MPTVSDSPWQRSLFPCLIILAVVGWFGGGATVDSTSTDEIIQLAALPLLLIATGAFLARTDKHRLAMAAAALAGLIACVPLLQLLPLPDGAWTMSAPRQALAKDLAQAGVLQKNGHWSLIPSDTERSLWALLPALACFLAALQLTERQTRRALQLVVGLVLANVAFGFFQVGVPPDSALRLYPDNGTGFSGVLVNPNHQASALLIGMLVALGLGADTHQRAKHGMANSFHAWLYGLISVLCLSAILLTNSSAGVILGLLFFGVGCLALLPWSNRRPNTRLQGGIGALAIALALTGGYWATRWMDLAQTEPLRHAFAMETWRLGGVHFPLGSGIGTFVPVFAQSTAALLQANFYVNHAHNEFAQWWMTGGLLAMLALAAALVLLITIGWRLLRNRRRNALGIGCWLAVCAMLAHSWVDYPLRTLSLMTMTALLAGLTIAVAARATRSERGSRGHALQAA